MIPSLLIIFLCVGAFIALVVDKFKRLPKKVFVFFVVSIVVSVCWLAFERNTENKNEPKKEESVDPVVYVKAAHDVIFNPGETRISLSVLVDGKRRYDCVRFVMNGKKTKATEQLFLEKVKFSLKTKDGTFISPSGILFVRGKSKFPDDFILKVFFLPKGDQDAKDIICIVENGFSEAFSASEISFGSLPENP